VPIGPYENFAACLQAQKKKYDADIARKVCGKIEQNTKGAHKKE
jgi:hypothetical protein